MQLGPTRSAGIAAATFLIVVAACSPSASGGPSPIASQPSASSSGASAGATATGSPIPTPSPIIGWQRSPDQAAFHDTALRTVVWTGSRFLATAWGGDAAIFDSIDGRAWHRQPPFPSTPFTSGPTLVAAGPKGVIAVGGGAGGPFSIWQSADGLAWTQAPDQDAFQMRDGAFEDVDAVIATDDGWLAVGGASYNCVPRCLLRALVMTSADGLHWIRQPDQPALAHAAMYAIARGPSGLVAVGTVMVDPKHGEAGLRAAAWTSTDGRAWTISPPSVFQVPAGWAVSGATDVELDGIARRGDRLVALGHVHTSSASDTPYTSPIAIAWWSDGPAWTPVQIGPFTDAGRISIASVPDGLLAVIGSGSSCGSGVWQATDGSAWRCGAADTTFDGYVVSGAAASPDVEVLVGYATGDSRDAAAWTLAVR